MINKPNLTLSKIFDTSYVVKFLLRLLAFYLFFRLMNWLVIGLIVPGGYHSPFVEHYLNYVSWLKMSILQTASFVAQLFGVKSHFFDNSTLQIATGGKLFMAWACVGLELMSFWAAFAFADTTPWRKKIYWCLGGLFCIWFINCLRVALLLVAIKNKWPNFSTLSHHDTFNIAAYGLILLMMFVYYSHNKKDLGQATS